MLAWDERAVDFMSTHSQRGYWIVTDRGRVLPFGDARHFGDLSKTTLSAPIAAATGTPARDGYVLFGRDGGVFTFGSGSYFGSMGDQRLNSSIRDGGAPNT